MQVGDQQAHPQSEARAATPTLRRPHLVNGDVNVRKLADAVQSQNQFNDATAGGHPPVLRWSASPTVRHRPHPLTGQPRCLAEHAERGTRHGRT